MKLIADLHTHTLASAHAYSTVTENTAQAEKSGLKFMAVTDHAPQMEDSPHVWHHHNLNALPRVINNVFVLRGIEADIIDNKGKLDIDEDLANKLDWIVASYHWGEGSKNEFTESYLKLLENPHVCCLGHTDSKWFPYDVREVCRACAHFGKAMELNVARIRDESRTETRDFYRKLLNICAEENAYVAVNTDSHFWSTIGNFDPALKLIEEAGFPEELLLTADAEKIKELVTRKKGTNIFE
ncbi:MAG: phosphatase [Bacteroides sp.]|nr:phosphatase [Bacteroides sp.]